MLTRIVISQILPALAAAVPLLAIAQVPASPVAYPEEHCHASVRYGNEIYDPTLIQGVIGSANFLRYQEKQPRWDIFCFADELVISSPLRSNGGSVVIFADRLVIRAPIDSRPYFKFDFSRSFFGDTPKAFPYRDDLRRMFNSYYEAAPDAVLVGAERYIPELPSGLTGSSLYSCGEGSLWDSTVTSSSGDLPVLPEAVVPGDIRIFARSIEVDVQAIGANLAASVDPLMCDAKADASTVAFIAKGVRGGRGGAGGAGSQFIMRRDGSRACVAYRYEKVGHLNSPGGKGGPGGHIAIRLVGAAQSDRLLEALRRMSNADGGDPGSSRKVRTPAESGPFGPKSWDVCGFIDEPQRWPTPVSGKSGHVSVEPIELAAAIRQLGLLLRTRDSRLDYSTKELLLRAESDARILSIGFEDYLERKLTELLAVTQARLAEGLASDAATGSHTPVLLLPKVLDELRLELVGEFDAPQHIATQWRSLSVYSSRASMSATHSFFVQTGGSLNVRNRDAYASWLSNAQRIENAETATKIAELRKGVIDIARVLNDIRELLTTEMLNSSIRRLEALLRATQKAKNSAARGNLDIIGKTLEDFGQSIEALMKSVDKEKPEDFIKAAASMLSAVDSYFGQLEDRRQLIRSAPEMEANLILLRSELNAFLADSAAMRRLHSRERERAVSELLEARIRSVARLSARSTLFSDLVNLTIASYASDLSRSRAVLWQNLDALQTFMRHYPSREPRWSLTSIPDYCTALPPGAIPTICTALPPENKWRLVRAGQREGWLAHMPLYVIPPTTNSIAVPNMRLTVEIEELASEPESMRFWNSGSVLTR